MTEILLHDLLSHQEEPGADPARFKFLRCGRRWGKTAFAEHISVIGHGPLDHRGRPLWKGLLAGLDIVWMGPTIPQTNIMWHRDVVPRFKNRPLCKLNENDKTVTFLNGDGTPFAILWVRSAEAAHSIRGIGAKLGGIVIDEAAHMDLEYVWLDVLRPTLMDCGGWAVIMSTTNAGTDGHQNEVGARTPSYFNIVCQEIQDGTRDPDYVQFYGTARDNPLIDPAEFDKLVAEYPPDSVTLAQEIFAKLVVGGAGVAFPEWSDDAHIARYEPPAFQGTWSGFGDWGYTKPGGLWLAWTGSERSLVRKEYYFKETDPYTAGYTFGQMILPFPRADYIVVDVPAVSDGGPTITEELQRGITDVYGGLAARPPVFIPPPKGAGSRVTKKQLTHQQLKYTRNADGKIPPWLLPKVQFHPDCPNIIRVMQKIPKDPKGGEDVDTNAEDHPYDALAGWFMARLPYSERQRQEKPDPDRHPGWNARGEENQRAQTLADALRSRRQGPRWTPYKNVGRH